jgi:hypothetical protein
MVAVVAARGDEEDGAILSFTLFYVFNFLYFNIDFKS